LETQNILELFTNIQFPVEEKKSPSALPKPNHHISCKIQAVCCHNTKNI